MDQYVIDKSFDIINQIMSFLEQEVKECRQAYLESIENYEFGALSEACVIRDKVKTLISDVSVYKENNND